jgi:hypothetical protein
MIRLDIQPYCDLCCDFDPDVTKPVKAYAVDSDKAVLQSDTIVQCKHAKRCESIKRYLERQIKAAENV